MKKSNPTVEQLKETTSINQSLSSLREVIKTLAQGDPNQFVPYRNNMLTKLMRDSIGGPSKTLMFVNISPADYNSQESKTSLFYGSTAKEIKNEVHKNVENQEVIKLKSEIKQLRDLLENRMGGAQVKEYNQGNVYGASAASHMSQSTRV